MFYDQNGIPANSKCDIITEKIVNPNTCGETPEQDSGILFPNGCYSLVKIDENNVIYYVSAYQNELSSSSHSVLVDQLKALIYSSVWGDKECIIHIYLPNKTFPKSNLQNPNQRYSETYELFHWINDVFPNLKLNFIH